MAVKRIFSTIGNSLRAILKGEFLLRLGVTRYFSHIVFVFVLIAGVIWVSLLIDNSMNKVEKNRDRIRELATEHTMYKYELERRNDRETVTRTLEELGSEVKEPEKPATRLK
ncbi:MAG: hypothetical protein MJY42_01290 [Bacteroidales bacterium]|nr:hypothetical protein [Bacteroidales bacterium]